nr:immunoglobulin light chain junction region [Macaca mulatta]MOW73375.1 immunoglobulin light chain junction region [Macaca mulatta]MOW73746.1 immunoglobulin light chain junction region [Macaca mulatta]MOW73756.1 immunoglobulin light chain junction region [Macaca mulatta]MOW74043.1 immunoglobulin light chain junction region [Macaca mulatta]
CLQDYTTPLTF